MTDVHDAIRKAASDWAELHSQNAKDTLALLRQLGAPDRPGVG